MIIFCKLVSCVIKESTDLTLCKGAFLAGEAV